MNSDYLISSPSKNDQTPKLQSYVEQGLYCQTKFLDTFAPEFPRDTPWGSDALCLWLYTHRTWSGIMLNVALKFRGLIIFGWAADEVVRVHQCSTSDPGPFNV